VTPDDTATQATKAQYPLRDAKIEVSEVPGKPGVYRATAFLRPHFQLDELSVSLRLVAELPASARK
jgi:type VI secretion system protein ImpC